MVLFDPRPSIFNLKFATGSRLGARENRGATPASDAPGPVGDKVSASCCGWQRGTERMGGGTGSFATSDAKTTLALTSMSPLPCIDYLCVYYGRATCGCRCVCPTRKSY